MIYKIKNASVDDIFQCADIMLHEYNNNSLGEGWSKQRAVELCEFYYRLQPDLFWVAKIEDQVVGFTFALVKPWAKGYCFLLDEICVKSEYRRNGIANHLLKQTLNKAISEYDIRYIKAETYGEKDEMPFLWYDRLGFKKEQTTYLINGEPNNVIGSFKK